MRAATLFCLLAATCFAQQQPKVKSSANKPQVLRLSDSYAKAAFRALKAIEGAGESPSIENGAVYGDKSTIDSINAADAEAVTKNEKAITNALRNLYLRRLKFNSQRDVIRMDYEMQSKSSDDETRALYAKLLMPKDPKIAAMDATEKACFVPFEDALRTRSIKIPQPCEIDPKD
jgi:hypothetical protein